MNTTFKTPALKKFLNTLCKQYPDKLNISNLYLTSLLVWIYHARITFKHKKPSSKH